MPYYIFRINPGITDIVKNLEKIDEFENFKQAKNQVRDLRAAQDEGDKATFKIMFAENALEAEEKLMETRDDTIVREWEK